MTIREYVGTAFSQSVARYLLSEHLVLLLQRPHPALQLSDLELAAGVGVLAGGQFVLQGALAGDGVLE